MQRLCLVRRCRLLCLLVIGFTLASISSVWATQAIVVFNDGRELRGEIVSRTNELVQLKIGDITTPIAMSNIKEIKELGSVEEQYKERRAKLKDDDLNGRYELAYWLFDQKAYQLASNELIDLKRRFPDDDRVELLLKVVQERMKMRESPPSTSGSGTAPVSSASGDKDKSSASTADDKAKPNAKAKPDEVKLLTDDQINLIKVWELPADFAKSRPPIQIPREVIQEVLQRYSDDPLTPKGAANQQKLVRSPGYVQLEFLFRLRAREYYGQAKIRREPPNMIEFRQIINPRYVIPYFKRYFGDGQIPGLQLVDGRTEAEAYTNFFNLQDFFYQGRPLIDRLSPKDSLLLQWGLKRDEASYPAPDVEGWRPRFNNMEDPNFQRYVKWIESLTDNPDYGIRSAAQPVEEVDVEIEEQM